MRASERERDRETGEREGGERKRRERAARESDERESGERERERERERSMVCEGRDRLRGECAEAVARSFHACLFQVFAVSTEAAGKRPRQQCMWAG